LNAEPSDKDGIAFLKFNGEQRDITEVIARVPLNGGIRTARARLTHGKERTVEIFVYARLLITTPSPLHDHPGREAPIEGHLFVVSWPTPEQALPKHGPERRRRYDSYASRVSTGEKRPHIATYVDYHDALKREAGHDPTQLLVSHTEVPTGTEAMVDFAFEGPVVVDYFLPGCGVSRSLAHVQPGTVCRFAMHPIVAKELSIKLVDQHEQPVSGARIRVDAVPTLNPNQVVPPQFDGPFVPWNVKRNTDSNFFLKETDESGRINIGLQSCEKIGIALARRGILALEKTLWTGSDLPEQNEFVIRVQSVAEGSGHVVFRVDGVPVANDGEITVADLSPGTSGAQIQFPYFSSDESGRVQCEQLTEGHWYVMGATVDGRRRYASFHYRSGMTLDAQ
jgi:hypothetical protein